MVSGRLTDKLLFVAIYTLVAVLVVIQGARHVANYAVDAVFYHNYLQLWETQLVAMRHRTIVWPPLDAGDPAAYMKSLLKVMSSNGLTPPQSNTEQAYVYRIRKIGEPSRQVLIVGTVEGMILYNLPVTTFERLDRYVDGRSDPEAGRWTGRWSTDGVTRIGNWRL